MIATYVANKMYTTGTLVCVFEYLALSRAAYNRLKEDFNFPSVLTLTRPTSKVKTINDSSYIKPISTNLA